MLLYKVVPASVWHNAHADGEFAGHAIDLADGYIHLSTPDQVEETLARHFAGQSDLVLVSEELALLDIHGASIQITPQNIQNAEPGQQVVVRVSVAFAAISWIPGFLDFGDSQLIAESSMRRESTN